ncbi:MAG: SDR family NAD(P)-dependent oxidoreductase [Dehalococcoidia bacterium]
MLKEFGLEGKTAIVTGAGRGIGRSIAATFAEAGADVVAAARTASDIEGTAEEVRRWGRRCLAIPTDVTKEDQVEGMVQRALTEFGQLDILVNNAGAEFTKPLLPIPGLKVPLSPGVEETPVSLEEWRWLLDTNLSSVFLCTRAVGPHMIQRGRGKIINITSGQGVRATPYMITYSTSKAAVAMFSRCLAQEWGRYGINVNALAPGMVNTPLAEAYFSEESILQKFLRTIPLKRIAQPREVALLAVYLASEASDYMTGQQLVLDGGGASG